MVELRSCGRRLELVKDNKGVPIMIVEGNQVTDQPVIREHIINYHRELFFLKAMKSKETLKRKMTKIKE